MEWLKVTSGLEKLLAAEETPARMAEWRKSAVNSQTAPAHKEFLTIPELAERWRIARPTVYNRLRAADVKVLDFAQRGGRGRKVVPMGEILKIEGRQLKRL